MVRRAAINVLETSGALVIGFADRLEQERPDFFDKDPEGSAARARPRGLGRRHRVRLARLRMRLTRIIIDDTLRFPDDLMADATFKRIEKDHGLWKDDQRHLEAVSVHSLWAKG